MKKLLIIFSCLILIVGCSSSEQAKMKISASEFESDISSVYAESAEFSGLPDQEFEQNINNKIAEDVKGALISFDTMVSESSDDLRMGNRCVLEIKQLLKYNAKNFISLIEEHYVYTGGAHGSTMYYPRNIDTLNNKILCLEDLFADGYEKELNRIIRTITESDKEKYSDLWEQPSIDKDSAFYISDGNLVIFFQPYELSYYAKGFIEFPIKLTEIEGFLKEEYKRLAV